MTHKAGRQQCRQGSPGHDALDSSFFADDLTRRQTQADVTNTYDLDPARRNMVRSTTSAAWSGTETSHYNDDTDNPSWTATDDGHWSRNVTGVDGDLVATVDDISDAMLQLTDLHGNVAATAATSSTKVGEAQVLQPVRSGSSWSFDPSRALRRAPMSRRVRQNDASGNVGTARRSAFTVGADAGPDHTYRDMVVADSAGGLLAAGGEQRHDRQRSDRSSQRHLRRRAGARPGWGADRRRQTRRCCLTGSTTGSQAFDQPWRRVGRVHGRGLGQDRPERWDADVAGQRERQHQLEGPGREAAARITDRSRRSTTPVSSSTSATARSGSTTASGTTSSPLFHAARGITRVTVDGPAVATAAERALDAARLRLWL